MQRNVPKLVVDIVNERRRSLGLAEVDPVEDPGAFEAALADAMTSSLEASRISDAAVQAQGLAELNAVRAQMGFSPIDDRGVPVSDQTLDERAAAALQRGDVTSSIALKQRAEAERRASVDAAAEKGGRTLDRILVMKEPLWRRMGLDIDEMRAYETRAFEHQQQTEARRAAEAADTLAIGNNRPRPSADVAPAHLQAQGWYGEQIALTTALQSHMAMDSQIKAAQQRGDVAASIALKRQLAYGD